MITVVDIFADIVTEVQNVYDPAGLEKPYFMHGHPVEIATILSEKDASSVYKFKKYPAICLFQDFDENWSADSIECNALNIAIITDTKSEFEASERYRSTFKDELYPIFNILIEKIKSSKHLNMHRDQITFVKTDRLYWGRNNQAVMNDFIDAIEISKLKLIFSNQCQL